MRLPRAGSATLVFALAPAIEEPPEGRKDSTELITL